MVVNRKTADAGTPRAVSPSRRRVRAAAATAVLAATLGLAARPALAAPPPFGRAQVSVTAREQPIGVFLQGFFRQAGLTAVISPDLTGSVNGQFQGSAAKVYEGLTRAFDLLTYYDGVAVYVYPAASINTVALPVVPGSALRTAGAVRELGLPDLQNRVRVANGLVIANGSRRFLDQVSDLARQMSGEAGGYTAAALSPSPPTVPPPAPPPMAAVAAAQPMEYRIYYLRYGWAEDVTLHFADRQVTLPGVSSILQSLIMGSAARPRRVEQTQPVAGPRPMTPQDAAALGALAANGRDGGGRDPGVLGFNLAAYGSMPPANAAGAWSRIADQPNAGPAGTTAVVPAEASDGPRVVADNRLNAVIVRDTRARLDSYDQLIRALDVEPQLVEIQATIIDIDTDKVRELGAGFNIADRTGGQAFTLGVGDAGLAGPTPGGGVFTATVTMGDVRFRAGIQALMAKGAAQVVAQPQLLTLSDVEAVFDNSKTFYIRVSGVQAADLYNITAGTTLRVTPHVTRDQGQTRVRLLIAIQDGSMSGQSVDKIPVVSNSGINTQALLLDGQSLLLGGLVTQTDRKVVNQAPGIGDVPVLGFFFRNTTKETAHTERLFLLTPRLVSVGAASAPPAGSQAPPRFVPQPPPAPGVSAPLSSVAPPAGSPPPASPPLGAPPSQAGARS